MKKFFIRTLAYALILLQIHFTQISLFTRQTQEANAIWAGVSGSLSVVPGLGQLANGNFLEAPLWFLSTVGAFSVRPGVGFNLWLYNIYDAYRDAKPKDRKFTNHNVFVNYLANFNPLNFFDLVGAPLIIGYGVIPGYYQYQFKNITLLSIPSSAFIGLGEEAAFRGFLFPGFSSLFRSVWAGAIVSSLLFGYAHQQYNYAEQAVVAGFGLVECWQLHRNKYDLRKNIFAHSWVDVFLLPRDQGPLQDVPVNSISYQLFSPTRHRRHFENTDRKPFLGASIGLRWSAQF